MPCRTARRIKAVGLVASREKRHELIPVAKVLDPVSPELMSGCQGCPYFRIKVWQPDPYGIALKPDVIHLQGFCSIADIDQLLLVLNFEFKIEGNRVTIRSFQFSPPQSRCHRLIGLSIYPGCGNG